MPDGEETVLPGEEKTVWQIGKTMLCQVRKRLYAR